MPDARYRSSLDDIIDLHKQDIDRTLLREHLRKTPDERVRELVELEKSAAALNQTRRRAER